MLPTCRSQLVGHIADPDHIVVLPKAVVPPVVHVLVLVIFVHPTDYSVPNQGIGICDLRFEVKLGGCCSEKDQIKKSAYKMLQTEPLTTVAMPELEMVIPWLELIPFIIHAQKSFWKNVLKSFSLNVVNRQQQSLGGGQQ